MAKDVENRKIYMGDLALLITALLGGAGIASFVNSLTLWSRKARLRNSVRQMLEDLKSMDTASVEHAACKASLSVQALELASFNLIKIRPHRAWGVVVPLVGFLAGIAGGLYAGAFKPETRLQGIVPQMDDSWKVVWVTFIVASALAQLGILQMMLSRSRSSFVSEAWRDNRVDQQMILRHSEYLKPSKTDRRITKSYRRIESLFKRSKHLKSD